VEIPAPSFIVHAVFLLHLSSFLHEEMAVTLSAARHFLHLKIMLNHSAVLFIPRIKQRRVFNLVLFFFFLRMLEDVD
jgi:hypothetical protein